MQIILVVSYTHEVSTLVDLTSAELNQIDLASSVGTCSNLHWYCALMLQLF